jgi:DNA-directed RNA polymerase II subunit RPB1
MEFKLPVNDNLELSNMQDKFEDDDNEVLVDEEINKTQKEIDLSNIKKEELRLLKKLMLLCRVNMNSDSVLLPFDIEFIINDIKTKNKDDVVIIEKNIPEIISIVDNFCTKKLQNIYGDNLPSLQKSLIYNRLLMCEVKIREKLASKILLNNNFSINQLKLILKEIYQTIQKNIINAGEPVGIEAATSSSEPTTQLTLNTFHLSGVEGNANVNVGMKRLTELYHVSANAVNVFNTIVLLDPENENEAERISKKFNLNIFNDFVDEYQIVQDVSPFTKTQIKEDTKIMKHYLKYNNIKPTANNILSKLSIRIKFNTQIIFERRFDPSLIEEKLIKAFPFLYIVSDGLKNMRLFIDEYQYSKTLPPKKNNLNLLLSYLKNDFINQKLKPFILSGFDKINGVDISKRTITKRKDNGKIYRIKEYILYTNGKNFKKLLLLDYIDTRRTISNDIWEVYYLLGIEAALQVFMQELINVYKFNDAKISPYHIHTVASRLFMSGIPVDTKTTGMSKNNLGILNQASYERGGKVLVDAAKYAKVDNINDITSCELYNNLIPVGSGSFDLYGIEK